MNPLTASRKRRRPFFLRLRLAVKRSDPFLTQSPAASAEPLMNAPSVAGDFRQQIGKDRSRQRWTEMAQGWSTRKNIQQHCVAQWQTFVKNTIPSPSRTKATAIPGRLRLLKPTTSSTKLTGVETEFSGLRHSCYRPRRARVQRLSISMGGQSGSGKREDAGDCRPHPQGSHGVSEG